jgi:hypothetical protein
MPKKTAAKTSAPPDPLREWVTTHHGTPLLEGATAIPGANGSDHSFIVTSVPITDLRFEDHQYNPRHPSLGRVNELRASVHQLGLLSALTCAYVAGGKEEVVLIDGRHRFDALRALSAEDKEWAKRARVDLKVYYGLTKSDLFQLATYLNRTRKALAKGEYYKVVVHIFEEKKKELEALDGRPRTEKEVFQAVSSHTISDRDFDLSIGRIVGMVAFDEEEDEAWYPMVGARQQERIRGPPSLSGYCPLTAGNLAAFLGYLCNPKPYSDKGALRDTEIGNVLHLGGIFRKLIIDKPVKSYETATGTSIACKHWCLVAFGSLLHDSKLFAPQVRAGRSPLAVSDPPWDRFTKVIATYREIMDAQAAIVRKYKSTEEPGFLKDAWSYQTQRDQVKVPLQRAFKEHNISELTRADSAK